MKTKEVKSKVIRRFLKKHTRLYEDWLPAQDVFAEPRLIMKFGRWKKSPCLPVWRKGNTFKLFKRYGAVTEIYKERPNGLGRWTWVWTDEYKKSHPIKTFFIRRPFLQLPVWLSFYKFNRGMIWKTKWEDYRFEYPPLFSLIFFGLSLDFWLKHPKVPGEKYDLDDEYWEATLFYTDPAEMSGLPVYDDTLPEFAGDLLTSCLMDGTRSTCDGQDEDGKTLWSDYYAVRPEFLKEPHRSEWVKYMNEHPLKRKHQ